MSSFKCTDKQSELRTSKKESDKQNKLKKLVIKNKLLISAPIGLTHVGGIKIVADDPKAKMPTKGKTTNIIQYMMATFLSEVKDVQIEPFPAVSGASSLIDSSNANMPEMPIIRLNENEGTSKYADLLKYVPLSASSNVLARNKSLRASRPPSYFIRK